MPDLHMKQKNRRQQDPHQQQMVQFLRLSYTEYWTDASDSLVANNKEDQVARANRQVDLGARANRKGDMEAMEAKQVDQVVVKAKSMEEQVAKISN